MEKERLYCSTGTFIGRRNGRDPALLPQYAPQLHCDGFELMYYGAWSAEWDTVLPRLCADHPHIPVLHTEKDIGELIGKCNDADTVTACGMFTQNCIAATDVGAKILVLHLWSGETSDRHIDYNIEILGELLRIAARYGMVIAVENIPCAYGDPLHHLEQIAARYDACRFTVDTRLAAFHRQEMKIFDCDFLFGAKRVVHIHVNDFDGSPMDWSSLRHYVHPGFGIIDFDRLCEKIRKTGYDGSYTVESPIFLSDGTADLAKMNQTLAFLRKRLYTE